MWDELRRVALFTSGVAELTRHQAERIVKDLVKSGDVRRKQARSAVKELMETSKTARKELSRLVRSEIQNQVEGLGLATKRDLDRVDRRVTRLEGGKKKTTTKKTTARKSTAKRSTAKRSTPRKSTASSGGTGNPTNRTSSSS
jgi:polyhydroxyalkanoate synthesis regulator phasin